MILKQIPEDFIVEEVAEVEPLTEGSFACYWLTKKNLSTMEAIELLAERFRIPQKLIGFAGNKDKKAITKQLISIPSKYKLNSFENIGLELYGYSTERVYLGNLKGNNFKIIARKIDKIPAITAKFINYFGEQRFSKNNAEIGKLLVKKDFKKCAELLSEDKKYGERIKNFLEKQPTNYLVALQNIPLKILRFYVSAYQSYLWNKCVKDYICSENERKEITRVYDKNDEFPVIGFDTKEEGVKKQIIDKLLAEENISLRDFIIKQIPELTVEGTKRKIYCEAEKLKFSVEKDELNEGFNKLILEFFLPKGCYATTFVNKFANSGADAPSFSEFINERIL